MYDIDNCSYSILGLVVEGGSHCCMDIINFHQRTPYSLTDYIVAENDTTLILLSNQEGYYYFKLSWFIQANRELNIPQIGYGGVVGRRQFEGSLGEQLCDWVNLRVWGMFLQPSIWDD